VLTDRFRLVGIIAAVLLSTTIATSTITQFAVTYPSRIIESGEKGIAVAWRLDESWGIDDPEYAISKSFSPSLDMTSYKLQTLSF
jgi:hypothetical protein